MPLIFTDAVTGSGSQPCPLLELCEYKRHPYVNSSLGHLFPIKYNCAILFLKQILCFQIYFPKDHYCKPNQS